MTEENRRLFIGRIFRIGGLFASYGAWQAWALMRGRQASSVNVSAVTERLLITEPADLIRCFSEARGGSLIYYSQMFFPTFITGREIEKVTLLEQLCQEKIKTADVIARARLRVIPAVAASHMLAIADGEDSQLLRDLILKTHRCAVGDDPCRMVLGLMWTSMTAALFRNKSNWSRFVVGQDIINAAKSICRDFVIGGDSTLPLMHSALAAWQFLLTYRSSLAQRKESEHAQELQVVLAGINELQATRGARCIWLDEITKLYTNRIRHEEMLPEYLESIVGRPCTILGSPTRGASDLFVLIRLQIIHTNFLVACGELRSPFFNDSKVADDLSRRGFAFLLNYGVKPADWKTLKEQGRHLLTKDCIQYFDSLFANYEEVAVRCGVNEDTMLEAEWFSKHVPFRSVLAEETVAEKVYSRRDILESAFEALSGASDINARIAFCAPALAYGCDLENSSKIATTRRNDMIEEVQNASIEVLGSKPYNLAFNVLSKEEPNFREALAKNKTTTPVGLRPTGKGGEELLRRKENMQNTHRQEKVQGFPYREQSPQTRKAIREKIRVRFKVSGIPEEMAEMILDRKVPEEKVQSFPYREQSPQTRKAIREKICARVKGSGMPEKLTSKFID